MPLERWGRPEEIGTVLVVVPIVVALAAILGTLAARRAARAQVSQLVRYE